MHARSASRCRSAAASTSTDADAVLLDRRPGDSIAAEPTSVEVWDLGEKWFDWTGLPFVFAAWVARPDVDTSKLEAAAGRGPRSRRRASCRDRRGGSAAAWASTSNSAFRYLRDNLHFTLGEQEFARPRTVSPDSCADRGLVPQDAVRALDPTFDLWLHEPITTATSSTRPSPASGSRPPKGLRCLESHDLAALGRAADAVTRRLHPETYRTYNIDRNINYTNVCTAVCDFCAFYRTPKIAEGYVLDRDGAATRRSRRRSTLGGDQILMQGGLHPEFKLEWYEELLRDIKRRFPQVNIHGFSPPEIHHFTKVSKLPLRTVLERLKAAGLGSLPGGGAEILVDRVRSGDHARQGADRRLAEREPRLARAGRPQHGDDDVRPRRNAGRADRAPGAAAAAAGRNGRLHRLHLLDVSARAHRHGRHAAGRLVRVSEDARPSPGCISTTSPTSSRAGSRRG